jgi:DNA-binding NtrC family response regulator
MGYIERSRKSKQEDISLKVLVVDDDRGQIETISRGLRGKGYDVIDATNADDALSIIGDNHAKIDMVITDYSMPGTNGLGLLKKIRETHQSLPVILMTAYSDKELVIDALHHGCDSFLEKPFTLEELIRETERAHFNTQNIRKDNFLSDFIPKHIDRINHPLSSIIGCAEHAMMQMDDPDVVKASFRRIVESAKQIAKINRENLKAGFTV